MSVPLARHEIPTHLDVADHAFAGLTMRQLLSAAIGLALAYGAATDLPAPLAARMALTAAVLVTTLGLVCWRPHGRAAEDWVFVLLRFWVTPRVAVWRPRTSDVEPPGQREVVLGGSAYGKNRFAYGEDGPDATSQT